MEEDGIPEGAAPLVEPGEGDADGEEGHDAARVEVHEREQEAGEEGGGPEAPAAEAAEDETAEEELFGDGGADERDGGGDAEGEVVAGDFDGDGAAGFEPGQAEGIDELDPGEGADVGGEDGREREPGTAQREAAEAEGADEFAAGEAGDDAGDGDDGGLGDRRDEKEDLEARLVGEEVGRLGEGGAVPGGCEPLGGVAGDAGGFFEGVADIARAEFVSGGRGDGERGDVGEDEEADEGGDAGGGLAGPPGDERALRRSAQRVTPRAAATVCMSLSPRPESPTRISLPGPSSRASWMAW